MNKQFIVLWLLIHSVFSLERFLRFSQNKDIVDRKSVYELDQKSVNIDAFHSGQILVKYSQYMTDLIFPTLNFYCHVKELDPQLKILNAFLCKKDSTSSKEDCHAVNKESQIVKFVDVMTFDIKFDPTIGFTATLSMDMNVAKIRKKPFDGFYYCKLSNRVGALFSNYIEIQDYEFYKKKLAGLVTPIVKNYGPSPIDDIRSDSFPLYVDCGKSVGDVNEDLPKWARDNIVSPFVWNFCPGSTSGSNCYTILVDTREKLSKPLSEYVDYYQYPNGTIVLLGVKGSDYVKSGIICSYITFPLKAYAIYLSKSGNNWRPITINQSGLYQKGIQTLSPTMNEITVREGTYEISKLKLRTAYVSNPDHSKKQFSWLKNEYHLPTNFESNAYELTFPSEITKEHTGKYTLKVSQTELPDSVEFIFDVKVVGVPSLKKGFIFSDTIYRMVDQTVNLSVVFEGNVLKTGLEINGMSIDFSSEDAKTNSLKSLVHQFPLLTGINVSFISGDPSNPGLIVYQASNLYSKEDTAQPKTHTVTFIAENDIGVSKASSLIRVFERPIFTNYLNSNNCTDNCKSTEMHLFKCSVNETEFVQEGLQVNYIWNLNEYNLNNMNEGYTQKAYMNIKGDTVELKPISSDDNDKDQKMAAILKNATLSCQVVIIEPKQSGHNPPPSPRLYSSDDYPNLRQQLKARIIVDINTIAKGSASWILALIISLIVLVILVVVILYFCLRGSGETYNVDQKERAQGYDPEKEIRDNETFQPYERDHDNSVMLPSRLSFNDDDSVGVGSEDGELDVYDIDPGKFNEEGSFIGQYASDPRKHKNVTA